MNAVMRGKFRSATGRAAILLMTMGALMFGGCTTYDPADQPMRAQFQPRWEVNEVPYEAEEVGTFERAGRNVRDGMVGIVDNWAQGAFSVFMILPVSGYSAEKLAIMLGDVIGLIDDNAYTEHVFKGIVSRQFLRFGSGARDFLPALSGLHQHTFEGPKFTVLDYVGPDTFHTKVYGRPSAVTVLLGVVTADFFIRPAGNFITIFGARETGNKLNETGFDVIQYSIDEFNFF